MFGNGRARYFAIIPRARTTLVMMIVKVGHHCAALRSRQIPDRSHCSLDHQEELHRHVHQQCQRAPVEGAVRHVDQRPGMSP